MWPVGRLNERRRRCLRRLFKDTRQHLATAFGRSLPPRARTRQKLRSSALANWLLIETRRLRDALSIGIRFVGATFLFCKINAFFNVLK